MKMTFLWMLTLIIVLNVSAQEKERKRSGKHKYQYDEVGLEDMMRRYLSKESSHELEGIYSVSCVITKRNKVILSKRERIRIVERKDNYARVAIIKDWAGARRDFIEISMNSHDSKKYPVVGELNELAEGKGLIYNHIEPDGHVISFSMISESSELLEGEYSLMEKRKTITYRLSYLKTYPKNSYVVRNNR